MKQNFSCVAKSLFFYFGNWLFSFLYSDSDFGPKMACFTPKNFQLW
jgi:hypothetical protein